MPSTPKMKWQLQAEDGETLRTYRTRKEAEAAQENYRETSGNSRLAKATVAAYKA